MPTSSLLHLQVRSEQVGMLLIDGIVDYWKKRILKLSGVDYLMVISPIAKACHWVSIVLSAQTEVFWAGRQLHTRGFEWGESSKNSTLGSSETPMEKANKTSSPSDYSGSNEGSVNISRNGVTGTAYPNSENELKALFLALLSLWHLRPFSDKYMKKGHLYPHFGVSGEDSVRMICYLYHTFNAFRDKNDSKATYQLNCLRPSFIRILQGVNVLLKEETNFAMKFTEIVFNMVHTSETAICINKNSENILYKTTVFSSCPDHVCLSHELFGMHKNATESTYFLNAGASELQNIEMKSFADVIKSVEKQFHCSTESNVENHPSRYFTTAFSYPSEKIAILSLDYWSALLSPWTLILFMKVFHAEGQDFCFAREEEKWLVYDKTLDTVKDFDSWEKVLEEYSYSSFCTSSDNLLPVYRPGYRGRQRSHSLVHCWIQNLTVLPGNQIRGLFNG